MLDIEGIDVNKEDAELLSFPEVGGLILFTRNYKNRKQLIRLASQVREIRSDLIIAVDQEGGRVQRFREEFEALPSLQKIGDLARSLPNQLEEICFSFGWLMASDILSTGIDISFAPVLDLDRDSCSAISDRSFSENPKEAIQMCRAYIAGMKEAGMASTVKHFPGHGNVAVDSHKALPVDMRFLDEVKSHDMAPFAELCNDYDAVMPGHLLYPNIDAQSVGFSAYWLQKVLRQDIGFKGVIFSDDLTMEGAAASGSYSDRARLALEAGCDMLLPCNNRDGAKEVLEFLQKNTDQASDERQLSRQRLERMRARKQVSHDVFQASEIYKKAHHYLDLI